MTRVALGTAAIAGIANKAAIEQTRRDFIVRLRVDPARDDRIAQARLAALILVRSFTRIELEGVPAAVLNLSASLATRVQPARPERASYTVSFTDAAHPDTDLYAGSTGWSALLSLTTPKANEGNALASLQAAALATQQAFNHAFAPLIPGIVLLDADLQVDLVTGATQGEPTLLPDLGARAPVLDSVLVGAGAVGQAIVYALAAIPGLSGCLEILDHEDLDASNAERYILASQENLGNPKTLVARNHLAAAHPFLNVRIPNPEAQYFSGRVDVKIAGVTPRRILPASAASLGWGLPPRIELEGPVTVPFTYQAWHDMDGERPRRFVVAAVDSAVARRDIQFGLHEVCMNVWTDSGDNRSTWGVSLHRVGDGACMACQYHEPTDDPGDVDDFHARQVGWTKERVREHYTNPARRLTAEDVADLQVHTGIEDRIAQSFVGKTLKEFVVARCGDGATVGNDRLSAPPVPHVPVIVGIQAAAIMVLHALGVGTPARIQGDALRAPATSSSMPVGDAKPGCLCNERRIQDWYRGYWTLQPRR